MRTILQELTYIQPKLPRVLLSPRPIGTTIKKSAGSHARTYLSLQGSTEPSRDTSELKDPRRRDLCEEEIAEAKRMGIL